MFLIPQVFPAVEVLAGLERLTRGEPEPARICAGLRDTLELFRHELPANVALEQQIEELEPVVCYPARLNQAVLGLMDNAREALDGPGRIVVRVRREGDHIAIQVQDDGRGIAESAKPHIFDAGYTTKGAGVGAGMGLAICHEIIQDHLGAMEVQSTVGRGTIVTLRVPVDLQRRPGARVARRRAPPPPPPPPIKSTRCRR